MCIHSAYIVVGFLAFVRSFSYHHRSFVRKREKSTQDGVMMMIMMTNDSGDFSVYFV